MACVPFASDLSQQVLERRRLMGELGQQVCEDRHLSVQLLRQRPLRAFVADPECGQPDSDRLDLTTLTYIQQR